MKFGGTSVASPDKVKHVASLVKSYSKDNSVVVVASAVRGMTSDLLNISESVRKGNRAEIEKFIDKVAKMHMDLASGSIEKKRISDDLRTTLSSLIKELEEVLSGMVLLGEVTPKSQDYLLSFGERLAAPLVSYCLQDAGIKSAHLTGKEAGIVTDSNFGEARPLIDTTKLRVSHRLEPLLKDSFVPVV